MLQDSLRLPFRRLPHRMRLTTTVLSLLLTLPSVVGTAQSAEPTVTRSSPYQLKTGRDLTVMGVGAVLGAASLVLERQVEPLTQRDILMLNRNNIPAFDRPATSQYSVTADRLSDAALVGNVAVVGLLTLGTKPMRQDIKTVAVMYLETLLIANGVERTVAAVTQRVRPFVYNGTAPLNEKLTRDARQSFFSGHATNAFATAVFTSEVFRHYFPDSKWKPVVWIGSLGLATASAALRYESGLHYPTDLLAGAAFGSLVGWGIPKLHQVKNRTALGRRLEVQPWSSGSANGLSVQYRFPSRCVVFP